MLTITIIIPARYGSKRFPGKPLALLGEKTILQHVYHNCLMTELVSKVVIATDDERIEAHCITNQMDYVMTGSHHQSGTDRIAEAVKNLNIQSDYIINVQGDEPFVQTKELNILAHLLTTKKAQIASLYRKQSKHFAYSSNEVKVVTSKQGKALYFSRADIPYVRDVETTERKIHIGIYGFQQSILQEITQLQPSDLELSESLEQLRWLENGYEIHLAEADYHGFGIDTPEDLEQAKKLIQ